MNDTQTQLKSLFDGERGARLFAADALIAQGSASVESLVGTLQDANAAAELRWRAAVMLGWIGDSSAIDALLHATHDGAWEVRHSAVWSLGMIGDARGFDALRQIATTGTPDEQINYIAALGMFMIDRESAQSALSAALDSSDTVARAWAHSALNSMQFR
jgi:HEAT repeat protein